MIAGLREYMRGPEAICSDQGPLVVRTKMLARRHITIDPGLPRNSSPLTKVRHYRGLRRVAQTALLNGIFIPAAPASEALPVFSGGNVDWLRLFRVPVYGVISQRERATRIHRRSPSTFTVYLGN
jgi:hypothetical protein